MFVKSLFLDIGHGVYTCIHMHCATGRLGAFVSQLWELL